MTQTAFEAALAAFTAAGGDVSQMGQFQNASPIGQDRIVRKEVSLGAVREIDFPTDHIGNSIAPELAVPFDDVIWNYLTVDTEGLAPARAEDAESDLAQKDDTTAGEGRASVIDWAIKDHYDPSDVNRARDFKRIAEAMNGGALPLVAEAGLADFNAKVARDRLLRRRKLDNRREWLIINAMSTGQIVYNDGKIKFTVDYGRPADQSASNPAFDVPNAGIDGGVWDLSDPTAADPIRFFTELNEWFFERYGVHLRKVTGAQRIFNQFWLSQKFSQRAGLGGVYDAQGNVGAPDLLYATTGWSPNAARAVVEASTGFQFRDYDSIYRTRAIGSRTPVSNRFLAQNRLFFEPDPVEMAQIATTQLGFAKTLTSPHPEGNWQSGFYEWERATVDPWGHDVGNGIKMFPVFPHMEYTVAVDVLLPAFNGVY